MMVIPCASPGPGALDQLTQTIQVLQQFQRLLPFDATLSDVANVLACLSADFSEDTLLEDAIQSLVGERLSLQLDQRRSASRRVEKVQVTA